MTPEGHLNVTNSMFVNNTAANNGGALFMQQNVSATLSNCSFESNRGGRGGAICFFNFENSHVNKSTLSVDSSFLSENQATNRGGAIFLNGTLASISNSELCNNTSPVGGALSIQGNAAKLFLSDTKVRFNQNGAQINQLDRGGAIHVRSITLMQAKNTDFIGNHGGYGGALVFTQAKGDFQNCSFQENVASYDGGGMFLGPISTMTLTNSTFTGNIAKRNGGALALRDSDCFIQNCRFKSNTAVNGGAFMMESVNTDISVRLFGSSFAQNEAVSGHVYRIHTEVPNHFTAKFNTLNTTVSLNGIIVEYDKNVRQRVDPNIFFVGNSSIIEENNQFASGTCTIGYEKRQWGFHFLLLRCLLQLYFEKSFAEAFS